ncbi:MAG: UvrD-helicase domain-containing protein [Deltaproteobacteria bacterium]|nr:UvrD-helicase domain-containing protein [Deltaproteobacteria bacterium]
MKGQTSYPQIYYLRASAGAGKTYQLTRRFLSLLAGMRPSAEALRQIVAITFTNRAAAEMKERIILALKQIALEQEEGKNLAQETGLQPQEASAWLDTILAHFSDFHIRTIDSLVYALLRAFSLEMGLQPELEVTFDQKAILNRCFDRLLSHTDWGEGDQLYQLLSDLLETYLKIEEAGGMVVENGIRRRLQELYEKADGPIIAGSQPDLNAAEQRLRKVAQKLHLSIREQGIEDYLHKRIFKPDYLQEPLAHLDKVFFEKASFEDLLTNKAQGIEGATISQLDALYQELKGAREDYLHLLALARVHAYMRALEELQGEIRGLSEREGLIIGGQWLSMVKEYFKGEQRTGTYAFLKLGSMVYHFLIDEFQDTSRPQWETLLPLVEETLSKGGSLFYVGDVKQAVYGWRGGDWRLFGEVATGYFPSVPPQGRRGETLTVNYRSLAQIVEFNNELYRLLTDGKFVEKISEMILGGKTGKEAKSLLSQLIYSNFEDVEQGVTPHLQEGQKRGKVEITSFLAPAEELHQEVQERLIEQVKEVWERRGKGIAVLVRRNQDAEDIAAWLMAEGIPVVTENSLRVRSSDLIKGLVAFLRFLEYPLDDLSFWGAIASRLFQGLPGLSQEALEAFLSEGRWQPPLYKTFERRFPEVSEGLIRPLLARVGFVTPYDLAREVVERFRLIERFAGDAVFIYRFLELIFQMEAKGQRSLSHFLQFWEEGGMEEKIGLPEEISAVRILTIHKAKGLEFPVVFIPFTNWRLEHPRLARLDDGRFVNLKRPLPYQLEEKRVLMMINNALEALNLLYVATTRAEEELYLYVTCLPRGEGISKGYLSAWLREMLIQKERLVS